MEVKLSVTIITFNEEENIEKCLDSVKDIADEILVVDSFSTDRTAEICKDRPGVKFLEHKFEGHIEQKNYALDQSAYDHVFSIDADEVVTEDLKKEVLKIKSNWQADGHSIKRANHYMGKRIRYCGWYPDRKTRLIDRRKARWGGDNPHDKIVMHDGAILRELKSDLLHFSYTSSSQHVSGINKFSTIAARAAFKKGKKAPLLKIALYPMFVFFKTYILRLGILDGYYGFLISYHHAYMRFLKYVKLRELIKTKGNTVTPL